MKILITGASGFAGTHLTEYYTRQYRGVKLYCTTYGGYGDIDRYVPEKHIFQINLLDQEKVADVEVRVVARVEPHEL